MIHDSICIGYELKDVTGFIFQKFITFRICFSKIKTYTVMT